MRRSGVRVLAACIFAVWLQAPAQSEEIPDAAKDQPVERAKIDLSVPEAPAFTALGLTPQEVIHPTSPRALAGQLLNGVDPRGNLQTGLAVDTSPYLLAYGNSLTLSEYNASPAARLLARTQVSLATAKGTDDDDEAVRVGLGFRLTPWDRGDPRQDGDLLACFGKNLRSPEAIRLGDEIQRLAEEGADQETIDEKRAELKVLTDMPATRCREASRARNWNASSWTLGLAPSWISASGKVGDLESNGASFWSSFAYGFEEVPGLRDASQLLIGARYNNDENVPDPDATDEGTFLNQNSLTVGMQLRLAAYRPNEDRAPSVILSLEGDYVHAERDLRPDDDQYRGSLGADFKIPGTDDLYFKVSVGGSGGGDGEEDDQGFVLGTLRFGS